MRLLWTSWILIMSPLMLTETSIAPAPLGKNVSRENSAYFLGFTEGMRKLADEFGPDWRPPQPKTLDILGNLARWGLGE
jgi:hypothetical protein